MCMICIYNTRSKSQRSSYLPPVANATSLRNLTVVESLLLKATTLIGKGPPLTFVSKSSVDVWTELPSENKYTASIWG